MKSRDGLWAAGANVSLSRMRRQSRSVPPTIGCRRRRLTATIILVGSVLALAACSDRPAEPIVSQTSVVSAPSITIYTDVDTGNAEHPIHAIAVVRDSTGRVDSSAAAAHWSTSDDRFPAGNATNSAGVITPPATLETFVVDTIIATAKGMTARRAVVIAPQLLALSILPVTTLWAVGAGDTIPMYIRGPVALHIPSSAIGCSSNPNVLTISADGRVMAKASGITLIKAALLGKTDSVRMRVVSAYRVVEIPQTDEARSGAYDVHLNENGGVLAQIGLSKVLWQEGRLQQLGSCASLDLNNNGEVLCSTSIDGATRLAIWRGDSLRVVDGFPDITGMCVSARFNAEGAIAYTAAQSSNGSCQPSSLLSIWTPSSSTSLSPPGAPTVEQVLRLDDAGNVTVVTSSGSWWHNAVTGSWIGVPTAASSSGGFYDTGGGHFVSAVNGRGLMAGVAQPAFVLAPPRGFWQAPGQPLQAFAYGQITGVNDADQATGYWVEQNTGVVAFLDDLYVGRLQDLTQDQSWTFGSALAINNKGAVVAEAMSRVDGHHALIILIPSGP
jgi:hypothetical protein